MTPDSIDQSLKAAVSSLAGHSESPRLDAELLLCKVLGLSRPGLLMQGAAALSAPHSRAFDDLVARRAGGAPVAHLVGRREFWSLELAITPDVLVPRPDTEVLVEHALAVLPAGRALSVLDLGTGSGAIALAIASERPLACITGVDVSARALAVAIENSRASSGGARARPPALAAITWRLGSWFETVADERFDVIVSNPPYVAANDPALHALAAEPALALTPGPTGLEALRAIIGAAPRHLNTDGWLVLEHGSTQGADVARLLTDNGFSSVRTHDDYSGKPRVTLGTLHSAH